MMLTLIKCLAFSYSENKCQVQDLDPFGLEEHVKIHDVVVVSFCIKSVPCNVLLEQLSAASNESSPQIHYARVDAAKYPSVRQIYGITQHPTVRIFRAGLMQAADYKGQPAAAEIRKWAEQHLLAMSTAAHGVASSTARQIDGAELRSLLLDQTIDAFVMFYVPGCAAVDRMAAELDAVSAAFRVYPAIIVARLDAAAHPAAAAPYAAHGLPAFVFFGRADPFFGFKPRAALYADLRSTPAMIRFLARKCGVVPAALPGAVAGDADAAEGTRDPPDWIFRPAGVK